jgi:hypothetical protein
MPVDSSSISLLESQILHSEQKPRNIQLIDKNKQKNEKKKEKTKTKEK